MASSTSMDYVVEISCDISADSTNVGYDASTDYLPQHTEDISLTQDAAHKRTSNRLRGAIG